MIVSITAIPGAGKTTLVKNLRDQCDAKIFLEPTSESEGTINNPFLDLYYKDPKRWSYAMQTFLLFERHKMACEAYYKSLRGEFCVLDGCCESDRAFSLVQKRDGYFTDGEYLAYCNMFNTLKAHRPEIDKYVWLELSPKDTVERIKKRSRECEEGIPLEYLEHLYEAYQEILKPIEQSGKLIRIDARQNASSVLYEVIEKLNSFKT